MLEDLRLIRELLEVAHFFRKAIVKILLTGFAFIFLLLYCVSEVSKKNNLKAMHEWKSLEPGDSIYVSDNVLYLDFYKKGKEKLTDYEQKEINYRREDTLNFILQNSVHEKYFYKNRTSFVGICLGIDSSVTKQGEFNKHRWIRIKPSYKISHPPKSDKYDYETRKWKNNSRSYFGNERLSTDFYIKFNDVSIANNDSIFNR
nr:hypothetical protein [uncultured Carboxylicivirga sp.]